MRVASDALQASRDIAEQRRRILVVDDEATVREVVGQYLEIEGYTVLPAINGLEALRVASATPPDLVILDLTLPGMDGLEVCRRLREASAVPILMLTARAEDADKLEGFHAGTDDYLTKPFNPRELIARVQAIMRRLEATGVPAMVFDDDLHFGSLTIRPNTRQVQRDGAPVALTTKEFDLLEFLAAHPKQVFTREQLLLHVWNYDNYGDDSTVTVHMRRLREKVEHNPARPRHLRTVWGIGYKFEP
ncbi:MAG TPA: response regulator transcription factor [Ktedonobacterales bacterium]|nr:response regulator transcription factor [Ktedonobacterales bacterium]